MSDVENTLQLAAAPSGDLKAIKDGSEGLDDGAAAS